MRVSTGIGTLDQIIQTITQTESARPSLNNPGNLIYASQPGASPSQYSFIGTDGRTYYLAQFDSLASGQQALANQITLDASRGMTIQQFTASYAPAGNGNDPTSYAQYIAQSTGLNPTDPLSLAISSDPSTGYGLSTTDSGTVTYPDVSGDSADPTLGIAFAGAAGLLLYFLFSR